MLKAERAEFQRTLDILRALKPVTVLPAFHGYLVAQCKACCVRWALGNRGGDGC